MEVARAVVGNDVFIEWRWMLHEPPGSPKGVPWHQDVSPFDGEPEKGRSTKPLFDFWLGLTEATEDMGCLQLIPGSQHRGRLEHHDGPGKLHPDLDLQELGYSNNDILTIPTEPAI